MISENAKSRCTSHVKIGRQEDKEVFGKYELGSRKERGEKWVDWCTIITSACFDKHPRACGLGKGQQDTLNQIEYLTHDNKVNMFLTPKLHELADHCTISIFPGYIQYVTSQQMRI